MRKYIKKSKASLLSIDNQVEVKILKIVVQFYLFPVASVFVLQR